MIDIHKHKLMPLSELATWERAQAGKIYPAGCIKIQVSATHGQLFWLKDGGEVESKYAVFTPKPCIDGEYLWIVLDEKMPEFLAHYQTGINIQIDIFRFMKIDVHTEMETQKHVAKVLGTLKHQIEKEQIIIDRFEEFKSYHLDKMMAGLSEPGKSGGLALGGDWCETASRAVEDDIDFNSLPEEWRAALIKNQSKEKKNDRK